MITSIPIMQLRHNSILIYPQRQQSSSGSISLFRKSNMQEQRIKRYGGTLSASAKKRLTKAVTLMVQSIKPEWIYNPITKRDQLHKLSFITLTVSATQDIISGKDAYKSLLSHFLQWLRRTKNVITYIWKAELQNNGQIHYHITTPSFIDYKEIRQKWNSLQDKAGIIEKYRHNQKEFHKDGFRIRYDLIRKWPIQAQKQAYDKGMREDWSDPNSTDIHEVGHIDNLVGYTIKYITKGYQNEVSLGGKVWDCSKNLKINGYFSVEVGQCHDQFLQLAVEEKLASCYKSDRFEIFKFSEPVMEYLLTKSELSRFKEFLTCIRKGEKFEQPRAVINAPYGLKFFDYNKNAPPVGEAFLK